MNGFQKVIKYCHVKECGISLVIQKVAEKLKAIRELIEKGLGLESNSSTKIMIFSDTHIYVCIYVCVYFFLCTKPESE